MSDLAGYVFDRYVNGKLMAEGVAIELEPDLLSAIRRAVRLAAVGPNGEAPVLVLKSSPELSRLRTALEEILKLADFDDRPRIKKVAREALRPALEGEKT